MKICSAFYSSSGNVARTDFTYTDPSTLGHNDTGTFDSFVDGEGAGIQTVKVWADGDW